MEHPTLSAGSSDYHRLHLPVGRVPLTGNIFENSVAATIVTNFIGWQGIFSSGTLLCSLAASTVTESHLLVGRVPLEDIIMEHEIFPSREVDSPPRAECQVGPPSLAALPFATRARTHGTACRTRDHIYRLAGYLHLVHLRMFGILYSVRWQL